jgi:uncharacterized protein with HEPN domain
LGIIESTNNWNKLREIRNNVSHEYPVADDEAIIALNQLFNHKIELERIFNSCLEYLTRKNISLIIEKYDIRI